MVLSLLFLSINHCIFYTLLQIYPIATSNNISSNKYNYHLNNVTNLRIKNSLINYTLSYKNIFEKLIKIYPNPVASIVINKVQEIYVIDQKILFISEDFIERFNHLEVLVLINNSLYDINKIIYHDKCFNNKTFNLKNITIKYNLLEKIYLNDLVEIYDNLVAIDLSHNNITNIQPTTHFKDAQPYSYNKSICTHIKPLYDSIKQSLIINLSHNLINYLPIMASTLSERITSLDLSFNHISYLSPDFFKNTIILEYFNIQNNNIKMISFPNILKYLSNLKILILNNNPLTFESLHHHDTFHHSNLQMLEMVNISTNSVITNNNINSSMTDIIIPNFSDLKYLNMSSNHIPLGYRLSPQTFSMLKNLTHLDIQYISSLYELPHQLFRDNIKLKNVNLNGITGIKCNCRYLIWFGIWLREMINNGSEVILPLDLLHHKYKDDLLYMDRLELNKTITNNFRLKVKNNLLAQLDVCQLNTILINDCFAKEPGNTIGGQRIFVCDKNVSSNFVYKEIDDILTNLSKYPLSPIIKHNPRKLIKLNIGQNIVLKCPQSLDNIQTYQRYTTNLVTGNRWLYKNKTNNNDKLSDDVISLSWYHDHLNKRIHMNSIIQLKSLNYPLTDNATKINKILSKGNDVSSKDPKQYLKDGSLLIRSVQRFDAGLYTCLILKYNKNKPNHVIIEDLPIVLFFGTEYFLEIWKSTILFGVGGAFTFLFFVIVIVYLVKCFKMCQCIHQRAKTQKFGKLIGLLQQQTSDEVENLRNHYINQLNKLKETCCTNIESVGNQYHNKINQFKGYGTNIKSGYMSQMKDYGSYLRDYSIHIKGYGSQHMESMKGNYIYQISRMREYTAFQVEKMMESYTTQVEKLNSYTYTQLDKLREQYKIKAKHIGDMIEMMNLDNCRTSIIAISCDSLTTREDNDDDRRWNVGRRILGEELSSDQPCTSNLIQSTYVGCDDSSLRYRRQIPFNRHRIRKRLDELSQKGDPFIFQSEAVIKAIWDMAKTRAQELWEREDVPHVNQGEGQEVPSSSHADTFSHHTLGSYLCPDLFGSQEAASSKFYTDYYGATFTPVNRHLSDGGNVNARHYVASTTPGPGAEARYHSLDAGDLNGRRRHQGGGRRGLLVTKSNYHRHHHVTPKTRKQPVAILRNGVATMIPPPGEECEPALVNHRVHVTRAMVEKGPYVEDEPSVVTTGHVIRRSESATDIPLMAQFDPEEGSIFSLKL